MKTMQSRGTPEDGGSGSTPGSRKRESWKSASGREAMNKMLIWWREDLKCWKEAMIERRASGFTIEPDGALDDVIQRLHELTADVDATGCDRLELARNWRHLADAQLDIAGGRAPEQLAKAVSCYKRAEALMEGVENSNERMLLEYGYGRAMFGMVRCGDLSVVDESKSRFARAQAIAQLQEPKLSEMIARTLVHLQLVASLIEERNELWRNLDRRENSRRDSTFAGFDRNPMEYEDARLFERLLELWQRINQVRKGEAIGP